MMTERSIQRLQTRGTLTSVFILYFINFTLNRIKQFKDLGVLFDEKLSFNNHIHAVVKSSYKNLGFIMRSTQCLFRICTIKRLYFAFVRSKLEYCFQVWNPIYNKYVIQIEYIQRKFARYCYFKLNKQYPGFYFDFNDLYQELKLISLQTRRKLQSCIYLYKILHNHINDPITLGLISITIPRPNSRNFKTFYCDISRTN